MLSITLQVNLHIVVHACKHCISDTFQSHNQNKGHVFEDDETISTIVAQSVAQSVKLLKVLSNSPLLSQLQVTVHFYHSYLTLCLPYMHTQAILLTTLDNYICSK